MEDEGLVPRFSWCPSVLAGSYFETGVRRDGRRICSFFFSVSLCAGYNS